MRSREQLEKELSEYCPIPQSEYHVSLLAQPNRVIERQNHELLLDIRNLLIEIRDIAEDEAAREGAERDGLDNEGGI